VVEVVVGYLLAFLSRGGRRWADRQFDRTLDTLWNRAAAQLGRKQVKELKRRPLDQYVQASVAERLEDAVRRDPAFATGLASDLRYLDSRNGREFVHRVLIEPDYPRVWWVVLLVLLVFNESAQTAPGPGFSPGTKWGFGLFFLGFVVLVVAGVAHAMTRTRED
jgi:hypothetical protein